MADFDYVPINTTAEKIEKISNMDVLTGKVETENDNTIVTATALLKTLVGNVDLSNYYIKLWQPNTEYKVGDVVVAEFAEELELNDPSFSPEVPLRTFVVKCIKKHTSANWFGLDNYIDEEDSFANTWEVVQETYAYYDAFGRGIHNTYATKGELAEAIGQALEGDY